MFVSIKNFIKKNKWLYRCLSFVYYSFLKLRYIIIKSFTPMNTKSVLFLSFMGEQYSDNPRALYEYMISLREFDDYEFYWVFKDVDKYKSYGVLGRAKIVRYLSVDYYRACARAKYWVSNVRMRNELIKRKNQIYLQTWHGTPLKKLGCDIRVNDFKDIGGNLKNLIKNYKIDARRYDYMLSVSDFYKEKITSAFDLKNIHKEDIFLDYGYPRNDILLKFNQNAVSEIKDRLGIDKSKKVILYAPTYREADIGNKGYEHNLALDIDALSRELSNDYILLFRLHYYVSENLDLSKYEGFVYNVSDYDDIARLYLISDILITDYSSVFFDFAILCRPIIFYMYDLDRYNEKMHDFYLSIDELPGQIAKTQDELLNLIYNCENNYDMSQFNLIYNPHRQESAPEIVKKVFA